MLYINHHDVSDAMRRYAAHPVLGPAAFTLASLINAVDRNSDGWAHRPAPVRAAGQLIALIGTTREYLDDKQRPDATPDRLRRAYMPLRAFKTRSGLEFRIFTPEEWAPVTAAAEALR